MPTIQDTAQFINGLIIAGLRPMSYELELREEMAKDMISHFSYATREELLEAGELLKNNKQWPTYREIEEVLRSIKKAQQKENPAMEKDAYPEGNAWQESTRSKVEKQFPQYKDSLNEANLVHFHWYFQERQRCSFCEGKDCEYSGHRPRLRISDNGRKVYPCVEKKLCKKYSAKHVQGRC